MKAKAEVRLTVSDLVRKPSSAFILFPGGIMRMNRPTLSKLSFALAALLVVAATCVRAPAAQSQNAKKSPQFASAGQPAPAPDEGDQYFKDMYRSFYQTYKDRKSVV
jgi:hypothetical protein